MVVGQVHDDGNEHREGLVSVCLENVQEVIVLKKAHRTVGNLQVSSADATHDPSE